MISIEIYLTNMLAVVAVMVMGWFASLYQKNVTIVDSLWGMGFVLIAWLSWFQTDGGGLRPLLLAILTTIWGVRLTVYLTRRNFGKAEDPRYAQWRLASAKHFWLTSLFKVFLLQAFFLWVIALAIQAGQAGTQPVHLGILDLIGTVVWFIGFVVETAGDWQLARFKSKPSNRGKVMNRGLWQYTRHPNYFGECLIWWGIYFIALSNPQNWWTAVSPVIMTLVLLKITGIPLTEKLLIEKRPRYLEYIENTSAFFPWLPKDRKHRSEKYHEDVDPIS